MMTGESMNKANISRFDIPLPGNAAPAVSVVETLRGAGFEAYLVGGAVRDLLIGLEPGDFDVATSAVPDRIREIFPGSGMVGASFGVCLVPSGGQVVETATFRSESGYRDGRHPDTVDFGRDMECDAGRRDFTVNALYLDPIAGTLHDFHGGRGDCRDRVLRTVGDPRKRFEEDGLRLLRAARISAHCGLEIEGGTRAALGECREMIDKVSGERIGRELGRILTGPRPVAALELLRESGVLERFMPEVARMHGVTQPPAYHPEGCVWTHTMLMLDSAESPDLDLALGILLHDVGKPLTRTESDRIRFHGHAAVGAEIAERILRDLAFPGRTVDRVKAMILNHLKFLDAPKMRTATLKRFLGQPGFPQMLELHRLDRIGGNGDLATWAFCRDALDRLEGESLHPRPLLDGRDLQEMGYAPGPVIGRVLEALETEQLEDRLETRDAARAWVRKRFPV